MPEGVLKETIKSQLLASVQSTRDRYKAGTCDVNDYVQALKRGVGEERDRCLN